MADKDPDDKPSLELPSFGFGRKKSKAKTADVPAPETPPTRTPSARTAQAPTAPDEVAVPAAAPEREPTAPARTRVERTHPYVRPAAQSPAAVSVEEPAPESVPGAVPARVRSFPALGALQAALVVGALVGLLGVLLIFVSLRSCELVRGTDSCGGSGLLLLIATVVALTYVGAWLLRGFGIDDPGSTSFLAVALLAVMVLVFLLDVIYSWWLVFVVPPVSMAMYALSWWVTTRVVETDDRSR